jgi:hypothetical protein
VFSGVFTAEEVYGVGDEGSGDITMFDVQTLLEAFVNMPLRSAWFIDEAFFSGKKQNFGLWMTLKCWVIRISLLSDVG